MSLFDAIKEASVKRACTVRLILDALPDEDRTGLEKALADSAIFATTIAKVLRDRQHSVSPDAIQGHRRGVCQCHR